MDEQHWKAPWLAIAAERGAPVDLHATRTSNTLIMHFTTHTPSLISRVVRCIMRAFFMPKFYVEQNQDPPCTIVLVEGSQEEAKTMIMAHSSYLFQC